MKHCINSNISSQNLVINILAGTKMEYHNIFNLDIDNATTWTIGTLTKYLFNVGLMPQVG